MNTYTITQLTQPEPIITVEEAKTYLRVIDDAEDGLIANLIAAATESVEGIAGVQIAGRNVRIETLAPVTWPIALPVSPVRSIASVATVDKSGTPTAVDTADYLLDASEFSPRLLLASDASAPEIPADGKLRIDLAAGYETVPGNVRQAVLFTVSHWFEARVPVAIGTIAQRIPMTAEHLLQSFKRYRL